MLQIFELPTAILVLFFCPTGAILPGAIILGLIAVRGGPVGVAIGS